jgi:hypothetical protein
VLSGSECRDLAFSLSKKGHELIIAAVLSNDVTPVAAFMGEEYGDSLRAEIDEGLRNGKTLDELAAEYSMTDQQIRDDIDSRGIVPRDGFFTYASDQDVEYWLDRASGSWRVDRLHFREAGKTTTLKWSEQPDEASGEAAQSLVQRREKQWHPSEVGNDGTDDRADNTDVSKRYSIGSWAEAGDLGVRIAPEVFLDSVIYANQSPDYYLIVKSVSLKNNGRFALNLEEVRLGSCAPDLAVGGYLKAITPPQPEFAYRCGIMDLLRSHGIRYSDIEPGQNVQLAPGRTVTLAFVYSLSSPGIVEDEISFRLWAVEVLEDGDVRDGGGSTLIVGGRAQ